MEKSNLLKSSLSFIFFMSGFSALIYQITWQRLLFTGIGTDLSSITVIVSVFMLGLGLGAFFGGRIADNKKFNLLFLFCIIEVLIGVCGLLSYKGIGLLQNLLTHAELYIVGIATFLFLLAPTFLMGTTLPLLTTFINKYIGNIGESIGGLYFANTQGAAVGALTTGIFLFNYLTLSESIYLAASINVLVAVLSFLLYKGKNANA